MSRRDVALWSLLLVPASVAVAYLTPAATLATFAVATLAIAPLAEWIRRATQQIARRAGPTVGGLLNVTLGNVAELVIALFVLRTGATEVVKGQITGSIIGNSLLGLGLAILVGTWGRSRQTFAREQASLLASLLVLSVIALLLPALFDYTERGLLARDTARLDEKLSVGVSIVLIVVYCSNLVYTLVTHRDVFEPARAEGRAPPRQTPWSLARALVVLTLCTAAVALEAEMVSSSLETAAGRLGVSSFFLGVIVLAIVGNAAEYLTAAYFARRDRMDLALGITVGSSIQVALLTAPVLVLTSRFTRHPMNLVFSSPLELIAIAAVAVAVRAIAQDGETTWFEGLLLLAVYALLALAFFFVTPVAG